MRTLLLLTLLPSLAYALDPPEDLVFSMDVDPSHLIANSVSSFHPAYGSSNPNMFAVRDSLGVVAPWDPPDMALLSTGNVDALCNDYDYPAGGESGDRATLRFSLDVPEWANSYGFHFFFLSREYPEYIGQIYNDEFQVHAENPAYTDQIVFDSFGNVVSVNNALFTLTTPGPLQGTCFDEHGGTGWVHTIAPVTPGSVLELTFTIFDRGDGVFDSAVLIDGFRFSETEVKEPETEVPEPDPPLRVSFLSPKEGPAEGGYAVDVHGRGFTAETRVFVDGTEVVDAIVAGSGQRIEIGAMPAHAAGDVDITVERGEEVVTLGAGFSYWDPAEGERPPQIVGVTPDTASTSGGTELRVVAEHVAEGAEVAFLTVAEDGSFSASHDAISVDAREVDGRTELFVITPEHAVGWADLIVVNPSGQRSVPGYPVEFVEGGVNRIPERTDCSCSSGGAGGWLLLLLPLMRRRR